MSLGSQMSRTEHSLIILAIGIVVALLVQKQLKPILWTATLYIAGYAAANRIKALLVDTANIMELSNELTIIISRISLLGYLLPLALLGLFYKRHTNYFRIGSFKNEIRFPLIWWGVRDPIWRNLLIALAVLGGTALLIIDFNQPDIRKLLAYGVLFVLMNAILEELLWRGYILSRFVDTFGEKLGLVGSSIAFGIYHYSLGFPLPVCGVFAIAGLFLGGVAIRSQGITEQQRIVNKNHQQDCPQPHARTGHPNHKRPTASTRSSSQPQKPNRIYTGLSPTTSIQPLSHRCLNHIRPNLPTNTSIKRSPEKLLLLRNI